MKVSHVEFHRNGSGDCMPFHAVHFTDKDFGELIGIVFAEQDYCAVVSKTNPLHCFRGEMFEEELRHEVAIFRNQK